MEVADLEAQVTRLRTLGGKGGGCKLEEFERESVRGALL